MSVAYSDASVWLLPYTQISFALMRYIPASLRSCSGYASRGRTNDAHGRPNRRARDLSQKSIPMLALIVPDISNPCWSSVTRAIPDVTEKYDCVVKFRL